MASHARQRGIGRALNNIGLVQRRLGNYAEALRHFAASLEIKRTLGNPRDIASTLHNLGSVQASLGNYPEALSRLTESLEITRALGHKPVIANTLANIGNVQRDMGNYAEALERLAEALEIERALGNKHGIARTLGNLGTVHSSLGNHEEALARFAESLEIKRAIGDIDIAHTVVRVGVAQARLGRDDEARASYERALRLLDASPRRAARARASSNLAKLHLRQGRADQAASLALEGLGHVASLAGGLAEGEGAGARELYWSLFDVAYRATLAKNDATQLGFVMEQGRAGPCARASARAPLSKRPSSVGSSARAWYRPVSRSAVRWRRTGRRVRPAVAARFVRRARRGRRHRPRYAGLPGASSERPSTPLP